MIEKIYYINPVSEQLDLYYLSFYGIKSTEPLFFIVQSFVISIGQVKFESNFILN